MIRARESHTEVFVLQLRGVVSTREFIARFSEVLRHETAQDDFRILFDWRSLRRWHLEDWSVLGEGQWLVAARRIERIALVHDVNWNRQAALFAAVLRRENVLVRSWRPAQIEGAAEWLRCRPLQWL
jgi:stage II sporulation SpoAA-like protein